MACGKYARPDAWLNQSNVYVVQRVNCALSIPQVPIVHPSPRLSPSLLHVAKTCRDQCFDFDNCDDLEDTAPALLASGVALLVLIVVSSLLFCLGIKCKYLGGARQAGGGEARLDPAKTPGRRASYAGANGGREEQKEARALAAAH